VYPTIGFAVGRNKYNGCMKKYNIAKTRVMKYSVLILFLVSFSVLNAQDFEWYKTIKNQKGYVKVLSEEAVVIVPAANENERYFSAQLPNEFKKDGLKVTFAGKVGKIPPHMRLIGTPLKLTSICIKKAVAKQYNLPKRSYKF
jgi:hypothetical protein